VVGCVLEAWTSHRVEGAGLNPSASSGTMNLCLIAPGSFRTSCENPHAPLGSRRNRDARRGICGKEATCP
jgi:hypothetical protein